MLVIKTNSENTSITEAQKSNDKGEIVVLIPPSTTVVEAESVIKDILDRHPGPVWCGECNNVAVMALVMKELKLRDREDDWVKDPTVH